MGAWGNAAEESNGLKVFPTYLHQVFLTLLVLDVETSGLNPDKSFLTCIGVASTEGVRQFAARAPGEEKHVLQEFADFVKGREFTLLTYNGRHFDLPFIARRAQLAGIVIDIFGGFPARHIDMMGYAISVNGGTRISKDWFFSKYLNMYVPRSCSGAWLARQYTAGKMSTDGHLQNLQHNATDLTSTLRAYEELLKFEDFEEFCNEQIAISAVTTV